MGKNFSRRDFLKVSGKGSLVLSLSKLAMIRNVFGEDGEDFFIEYQYRTWEDLYRKKWTWDKVTWGVHLVDCYPGNCLWRVYTKNGIVWREEQAGKYKPVEDGVPDLNPRGCQKGASYSNVMYGPERLKYPLKRVGKRGDGKWKRISWDEALGDIADSMLDAIKEFGPESIVYEHSPGEGGYVNGIIPGVRLCGLLRTTQLDLDSVISDFNAGLYETFGKFQFVSSVDDWYHAELILIWHMNPVYTRIPSYHYITEAFYKGSTVVCIAPDFSPSSIHADYYVPVKIGTDAALGLSMCKVIIDEKIYNAEFMREQTDLPFLVKVDTKKFLRCSEMEEGGRDNQFYLYDEKTKKVVKAPRKTLKFDGMAALEGKYKVKLKDGKEVEVMPVFEFLKEHLKAYEPEKANKMCGVHPETIRMIARKAAKMRTHILVGWNTAKYYHGDLIERAQCLLLGLTGNWGKKGTGTRGWNESLVPGVLAFAMKTEPGVGGALNLYKILEEEGKKILKKDPELPKEMVAIDAERDLIKKRFPVSPAAFYWYYHCGYKEVWNNKDWSDPYMKRDFDSYFNEAIDKGWWDGFIKPGKDVIPRVFFGVAGNTLRRTRGGLKMLLDKAWPNYKMIVSVDVRMSTTAMYSDIILPAAGFYEKLDMRFPTPHVPYLTITDKAVEPIGESKTEWEIFCLLAKKLEERAKARGIHQYTDRDGYTIRLDNIYSQMTLGETMKEHADEKIFDEMLRDSVLMGTLPKGTDLKKLREEGIIRFISIGSHDPVALNMATDIKENETINPLRWHTEKKVPYPTLTQRAQFYIDHDWFLEGEESLPTHKDNPTMGGKFPFEMTSGHQRWSIHSIWVVNPLMLATHRGEPFLFVNPDDAKKKGVADHDMLKVHNDFNTFYVRAKISAAVRPGQVIIYHAWDPYQFKGWKSYDAAIPGLIKWLHFVGGYGHLRYWRWNWCLQQVDRATRVDFEKE